MSVHRVGADADGVGIVGVARWDVADADLLAAVIIVVIVITRRWSLLAFSLGVAMREVAGNLEIVDLLTLPIVAHPLEQLGRVRAPIGAAGVGVTSMNNSTVVVTTRVSWADGGLATANHKQRDKGYGEY
jgi:hypothetical protein